MNWIRDNIIKIVVIVFILIVGIVAIVACSGMGSKPVDSASGYIELENRLQNAAISYVKEHPSLLPKSTDRVKKINLDTLINNNKIGKLYSPENRSTVCKGYVEIEKLSDDSKDYRYIPYISCGKYYTTKTIADYIIDKEITGHETNRITKDGLYPLGNDYIFKGEFPENFIYLDDTLYRIVRITEDKNLKLISTVRTENAYTWDDRYNITEDDYIGINDFIKSRLYDSLLYLYENENEGDLLFTEAEKKYIVKHDFCIGKRDYNDENIYSNAECSETYPMNVGLLYISEYAMASIDPNCNNLYEKSCVNYNYLSMIDNQNTSSIATLTAVSNNTYEYYKTTGSVINTRSAKNEEFIYPVIYIDEKVIYKSGSGTYDDPYVVR